VPSKVSVVVASEGKLFEVENFTPYSFTLLRLPLKVPPTVQVVRATLLAPSAVMSGAANSLPGVSSLHPAVPRASRAAEARERT